jgi:hypothetical protein
MKTERKNKELNLAYYMQNVYGATTATTINE